MRVSELLFYPTPSPAMNASAWPFPLMPMEVVDGADALVIAQRAYNKHDARWIPSPPTSSKCSADGDVARYELGVAAIKHPQVGREQRMPYVLPADKKTWRGHGLLHIMTMAQFTCGARRGWGGGEGRRKWFEQCER